MRERHLIGAVMVLLSIVAATSSASSVRMARGPMTQLGNSVMTEAPSQTPTPSIDPPPIITPAPTAALQTQSVDCGVLFGTHQKSYHGRTHATTHATATSNNPFDGMDRTSGSVPDVPPYATDPFFPDPATTSSTNSDDGTPIAVEPNLNPPFLRERVARDRNARDTPGILTIQQIVSVCQLTVMKSLCPIDCSAFTDPVQAVDLQSTLLDLTEIAKERHLELSCPADMCPNNASQDGNNTNCADLASPEDCASDSNCHWTSQFSFGYCTDARPTEQSTGVPSTIDPTNVPVGSISYQPLPLQTFKQTSMQECFNRCDHIVSRTGEEPCASVFVGVAGTDREGECHLSPLPFGNSWLTDTINLEYFSRARTSRCYNNTCTCSSLPHGGELVNCEDMGLTDIPPLNSTTVALVASNNDLYNHTLTGRVLSGLSQLKSLVLARCGIRHIETGAFSSLISLEVLDLSFNEISSWAEHGLVRESGLYQTPARVVDLTSNLFTSLDPSFFMSLPDSIEVLKLGNMHINRIRPHTFDSAPEIQSLEMTGSDSACSMEQFKPLQCFCADGFASTNGTFCEPLPPAPSKPLVQNFSDAVSVVVDNGNYEIDDKSHLVVTLLLYPDNQKEGHNVTYSRSLCCDDPKKCPDLENCTSYMMKRSVVMVEGLDPNILYRAALKANSEAGIVMSDPSDTFYPPLRATSTDASDPEGDSSNVSFITLIMIVVIVLLFGILFVVYRQHRLHRKRTDIEHGLEVQELTPLTESSFYPQSSQTDVDEAESMETLKDQNPYTESTETLPTVVPAGSSKEGFVLNGNSPPQLVRLRQALEDTSRDPLSEPESRVERLDQLASGEFGDVHKGMLHGYMNQPAFVIAIKEAKGVSGSNALYKEANIMTQFNHPNILGCVGVMRNPQTRVLLEYCESGDLRSFLRNSTLRKELGEKELLSICANVVQGCAHIHGKGYIHRDIAARNVLLSSHFVFKISDFGLCRRLPPDGIYRSTSRSSFPLRWTAPESFNDDMQYSKASDVWSWAILAFEVLSCGTKPFAMLSNDSVMEMVQAGYKLKRPFLCSSRSWSMFFTPCLRQDPTIRPSFAKLEGKFTEILGDDIHAATVKLLRRSVPGTSEHMARHVASAKHQPQMKNNSRCSTRLTQPGPNTENSKVEHLLCHDSDNESDTSTTHSRPMARSIRRHESSTTLRDSTTDSPLTIHPNLTNMLGDRRYVSPAGGILFSVSSSDTDTDEPEDPSYVHSAL